MPDKMCYHAPVINLAIAAVMLMVFIGVGPCDAMPFLEVSTATITLDNPNKSSEPIIMEIIDAQKTDAFVAGVKALTQLYITGANLTTSADFVLHNIQNGCGWRCPGCCVDKVLPKEISCAVQRTACNAAASGCDAACTATAGACIAGCEAARVICLSRVCV